MLRSLTANNPSPLTGPGTNTFLIGTSDMAVIDPGPDDPDHRAAILEAAGDGRIATILVTHAHKDHSAGARKLAEATGASIAAFGAPTDGRSPAMAALADAGIGGGEGLDSAFMPDRRLADGEVVAGDGWQVQALHLPGHFAGHLCFAWGDTLFSGDLILGWASTLISPPDGDLIDYLRSLQRVTRLAPRRLLPAHGAPVEDPAARIAFLTAHRHSRTASILAALQDGPATARDLADRLYDVPANLRPAAARNVLAHLLALEGIGAVTAPELRPDAPFTRSF